MNTILFICLAYIGGKIGLWIKIPAGALLGSMLFIGIVKTLGWLPLNDVSHLLRIGTQIALGTMIGLMFSKDILKLPFEQISSFFFLGIGSILSGIAVALVFTWLDIFPIITSLIATAPGGVAEMLTLSHSVNSNSQAIAIMHVIRFISIIFIFKILLNFMSKRLGQSKNEPDS